MAAHEQDVEVLAAVVELTLVIDAAALETTTSAATPSTTLGASGSLPATGADSTWVLLAAAVALLGAGTGAALASRRRSRT